jgi:hypothetical protein
MVKALDVVDGVGLARALCAEPNLAKDIVEGRIRTGAVIQRIDRQDYGLTETVAGTQIRQMGSNQAPMDLTKEDVVEAFQKSTSKWERALEEDGDKSEVYGYVVLEGVELTPMSDGDKTCKL